MISGIIFYSDLSVKSAVVFRLPPCIQAAWLIWKWTTIMPVVISHIHRRRALAAWREVVLLATEREHGYEADLVGFRAPSALLPYRPLQLGHERLGDLARRFGCPPLGVVTWNFVSTAHASLLLAVQNPSHLNECPADLRRHGLDCDVDQPVLGRPPFLDS